MNNNLISNDKKASDLYNDYKKGIITYDEMFNLLVEKRKERENKNMELNNKELNIISDYAKGKIDLNKCYELIKENKKLDIEEIDLDKILSVKLDKEFDNFCENLKTKTPEEIIEKSYEITVKDELKEEIKNMNLHDKEKAIMIEQNDLLTEFYHDWLDTDVPLGDVLKETLEESVSTLTRYYGKQDKFRIEK
jgi:hypothetical protein